MAPTPDALAPADRRSSTVLVVDVLRASTTIVVALASGCVAVVPVGEAEEARGQAGSGVLIAGERGGESLPGFDLGNSPPEFTPERVGGRTVVLTTTNGTRALLATRGAPAVGIAALVNLGAVAAWALAGGRDVAVVCAGEDGAESLEDLACAGLIVEWLAQRVPVAELSPRATRAAALGRRYRGNLGALGADAPWARRLVASGRADDVAACLRLDTTPVVPVWEPGTGRVVACATRGAAA